MDKTVSESGQFLSSPGSVRRPVLGVLEIFARAPCPLVPHRIETARSFGRGPEADVRLSDGAVSRLHARLEPVGGTLLLTDLGSRNGCFVDGVAVAAPLTPVKPGNCLRLAKTLLLVSDDLELFEQAEENRFPQLVGGPALHPVRLRVALLARQSSSILVEGPTGSGKEVVARLVHRESGRSGRFVAVNCAALPLELVESELFGHARGAFSGSTGARQGLFRSAHRGTLFLDEVAELPAPVQAKLLRVLESGELRSVGEDDADQVDVRVIGATHRDLDELVAAGEFRGDLLHRLAAARITLPALDQRREDIPLLTQHFLGDAQPTLNVAAMETLMRRSWRGNLRELRNVVELARAGALAAGRGEIMPEDIEEAPASQGPVAGSQRERITQALKREKGNVTRAARALGVARSGLYLAIQRLGIDPALFRQR